MPYPSSWVNYRSVVSPQTNMYKLLYYFLSPVSITKCFKSSIDKSFESIFFSPQR